ncbi:MAG: thiL [Caulobacteraceae bacterium]|nr:thiL [Caulobacteraceae bacterium]
MPADEFDTIARLFSPLTLGHPGALDLLDDAAFLSPKLGFDLVLTKDALVEGVHFLADDPPDLVARKLLRVNLSDLAAKGAEPFGYMLACAWSPRDDWERRAAFAQGLAQDGREFGLSLLGGDTVSTPGPATFSVTMLGYVPSGAMRRRAGAREGDLLLVSGPMGDGVLGLAAARGELADADGYLASRYRLPAPRLDLRSVVREQARASADISDGLLADAGHIARAAGLSVEIELDHLPLSAAGRAWLESQVDLSSALLSLAAGGDDYELAIAAPGEVEGFIPVGRFAAGRGVAAFYRGAALEVEKLGWRHD